MFCAVAAIFAIVQFLAAPVVLAQSTGPDAHAIQRDVHYLVRDGTRSPVSDVGLAAEIASEFPQASRYGAFSQVGQQSDSRGTYEILRSGVVATAKGAKVHLEYVTSDATVGGTNSVSATRCDLLVEQQPDSLGHFLVTASPLSEQLGHEMVFMTKKPLDSIEKIGRDVSATLANIPLAFTFTQAAADEIDVPYPPAGIFANFERHLGKPIKSDGSGGDSHMGRFSVSEAGAPTDAISVKVFPYHTGSKVQFEFISQYRLNPDGTTSLQDLKPFIEKLRAIAKE
jgi:hypothetical protein